MMKNNLNYNNHVIGIPMVSFDQNKPPKRLLCQTTSATHHHEAAHHPLSCKKDYYNSMNNNKNRSISQRVDNFTRSVRRHVRVGARMMMLQVGGVAERVFRKNFKGIREDEKLLKAFQCYLSTTAGPIQGFLFISTDKVAFCSEKKSIKVLSPSGKFLRVHYKVSIPVEKIKRANGSENVEKPWQKYVQVVTEDDFEFWFMGFFNHQKTLRCLHQAIINNKASDLLLASSSS